MRGYQSVSSSDRALLREIFGDKRHPPKRERGWVRHTDGQGLVETHSPEYADRCTACRTVTRAALVPVPVEVVI